MAILSAVQQEEVVLGGVSEVGEFRIRNSAKAFSILSSGLYANKIKAIIRELSTNAVDSHVAAGRADTPFDVHLPNSLEPWFAIRDYGTGLDHDQVTQIYTTYFESTKTGSNDFVGALGLGSKSPFAYTDNFTVTAVKDGVKRIYSAFINPQGVPSIAKMGEEATADLSGVEIKFSVNDQWEYSKFRTEAASVYKYFTLRPVVSGNADFAIREVDYDVKDIAPGVHSRKGGSYEASTAVMGNIAYPIDIPQAQQKELGGLADLLDCNLEIHFGIGELDFQASREGLSYIPQTVQAIKRKLEEVNSVLAERVKADADKITNAWQKAHFLLDRQDSRLWRNAVIKYISDTKFDMVHTDSNWVRAKAFSLTPEDLAKKYNIVLTGFLKTDYSKTMHTITTNNYYNTITKDYDKKWEIDPVKGIVFVENDLNKGALARAKYHWSTNKLVEGVRQNSVFIASPADADKPMKFAALMKHLQQPNNVVKASALTEKPKADRVSTATGEKVNILHLEYRTHGYRPEIVWANAGKASDFDSTVRYYVPLVGYNAQTTMISEVKNFLGNLKRSGIKEFADVQVYGVRKTDLAWVEQQANWVNLETHFEQLVNSYDKQKLKGVLSPNIDIFNRLRYTSEVVKGIDANSPFKTMYEATRTVNTKERVDASAIDYVLKTFKSTVSVADAKAEVDSAAAEITARYPLLARIDWHTDANMIAEYINMVDAAKGV